MANKAFEIQSTQLSIGGVTLDTSANGKLVLPGITRAATSVVIEVQDTYEQTVTWADIPVVIDGYTYEVYVTGTQPGLVDWQAATYIVDALDGEGYIDGITVSSGGNNYTGEAITYSEIMYAAPTGTPIDSSSNTGVWIQIPFMARCGAGEITSEFGGSLTVEDGNTSVNSVNTLVLLNGGSVVNLAPGVAGFDINGGGSSAGSFSTLPDFLDYVPGSTVHAGQTAEGLFFSGNSNGTTYPVRTNSGIAGTLKVVVTLDMVVNDECSDFSLCVFPEGTDPQFSWGTNSTRIAAQYNCTGPNINGLENSAEGDYSIPSAGTYRVRFTYDPMGDVKCTFETLDTFNTVLNTTTLDETLNTENTYMIGFTADQDSTNLRTYIKNLTIDINNGQTVYTDTLMLSGGGSGTPELIQNATNPNTEVRTMPHEVIVLIDDNKEWQFLQDGSLMYPDGTVQQSAPKADTPRSWMSIFGNGANANPYWENWNTNDLFFDLVTEGPNGTVFAAGGWTGGTYAVVVQYDKDGNTLWRWMDNSVRAPSALTYDSVNDVLYVVIPSYYDGRTQQGNRIHKFIKQGGKFNHDNTYTLHDGNDNGDLTIRDIGVVNNNWYAVGEKYGTFIPVASGLTAGTGSNGYPVVGTIDVAYNGNNTYLGARNFDTEVYGTISLSPSGMMSGIFYDIASNQTHLDFVIGTFGEYVVAGDNINGYNTLNVTINSVTQSVGGPAGFSTWSRYTFSGDPFGLTASAGTTLNVSIEVQNYGGIINLPKSAFTAPYPTNWNGYQIKSSNDNGVTLSREITGELGYFYIRQVDGGVETNGTGIDSMFNVRVDYNTGAYNIDLYTSGSGFMSNDTVTIKGRKLGGVDNGLIQGANPGGVDAQLSTLLFATATYTTMYALLTDGRTWTVTGGVLGAGVTVAGVVDNGDSTITVTLAGGDLTGYSPADSYTFTAPGNDTTFNVQVWGGGPGGIWYISSPPSGTADTTYFRFNYTGYGYHNLTSATFEITQATSSDPFIYTNAHEFAKIQEGQNWGRYESVAYNSTTDSYYAVGGAWAAQGDEGLITKINSGGNIDWTFTAGANTIPSVTTNNTDKVFYYNQSNNSVICLNATTGNKVWESKPNYDSYTGGYDNNSVRVKYFDGYLYIAGQFYTNFTNRDGVLVEKIDSVTGSSQWSRMMWSNNDNWNIGYDWQGDWFAVNETGCYFVGYDYFRNDNYDNAGIAKIPLDGGVSYDVADIQNDRLPDDIITLDWKIAGKWNGTDFATFRELVNDTTLDTRTDLTWINSDFGSSTTGYSETYPYFANVTINLTSGIEDHDPTFVTESRAGWSDNTNYYLHLSDAGKFIRTTWDRTSHVYLYVPSDESVNFPIGTIITLVNMMSWNNYGSYMYIRSDSNWQDNSGNGARVYLADLSAGYSPEWGLKGRGTATLMKVGPNEWLLSGANIVDTW